MASRLSASPSRIILDLIKKNPPMSSLALYQACPREVLPSRRKVKVILQSLKKQNRIQAYLPAGGVRKVDSWVYKLNPMKEKENFPHASKSKAKRHQELKYVLSLGDDEPIVGLRVDTEKDAKKFVGQDDVFNPTKE